LKLKISSVLLAGKGFTSLTDVASVFKEKTILVYLLNSADYEKTAGLISEYDDYLCVQEQSDVFYGFSYDKKQSVINILSTEYEIENISQFSNAFKTEVIKANALSEAYITSIAFNSHNISPEFSKDVFSYKVYMQDAEFVAPYYSISNNYVMAGNEASKGAPVYIKP